MATSIKTRKMTAHKNMESKKSSSTAYRSPTKITKFTLNLGGATNNLPDSTNSKQKASPTPSRSQNGAQNGAHKGRDRGEKVRASTHNIETNYESENMSHDSDDGCETIEIYVPFAILGELEQACTQEIDPREFVLSFDTIPMVLLDFLTRIEKLETRQLDLETENSNLKGSLDFAFQKIVDLEKKEAEQLQNVSEAQNNIECLNNENTKLKVDAERNRERNIKSELYSRRSNLRFEGIPQGSNESNPQCCIKVYDILKRNLNIQDADERIIIDKCHRDEKYPNQDPPSILVRFLSLRDRQEVWEAREKVNLNRSNAIFINEDFPQEIEKRRAFFRPYLKAAYASKR